MSDFAFFKELPNAKFPPEEEIQDDELYDEEEEEASQKELSKTIEELDLSLRSFNCLKRAGFDTVDDIVSTSESELKEIKNFGKKSLTEVIDKLEELGLSLKED